MPQYIYTGRVGAKVGAPGISIEGTISAENIESAVAAVMPFARSALLANEEVAGVEHHFENARELTLTVTEIADG